MFELATNSTVTVTSVDPHLVYATYALVIVSVGAVVVAALQNRKTQKLMAEQSIVMGKQVDQAIAQTRLQQQQMETVLKQHLRPRVQELIQIILSPAISILDSNTIRGREFPLELRNYLTLFLTDKNARYYDQRSFLVLSDFELEYKELAGKMKRFDKERVEPVRLRYLELHDALLGAVIEGLPAITEKHSATLQSIKVNDTSTTLIVDQGILPALQRLPEQVATIEAKQFWDVARSDFLELTKLPEIITRMDNLKAATGKCADVSESLSDELSTLRNRLGTEYGITHDQYFVPETPTIYLEER